MKAILIIVNAAPYGNERMLSALRLATAIVDQELEPVDVRLFMMSDAVTVGLASQGDSESGGGLQEMLKELTRRGVPIRLCRTCAQMRGIAGATLVPGVAIGTLPELAAWTLAADKVITF